MRLLYPRITSAQRFRRSASPRRAFFASRGNAPRLCGGAPRLLVRSSSAYKRKALWILNRFHSQIDIQFRPIEMVRARKFNVDQFADASILEPRKFFESDEP